MKAKGQRDDSGGDVVYVIGAGVAGLATARSLQLLGRRVAIVDPLPSPGGASFGNGGFISPQTAIPAALPGMLRNVPRWLLDQKGPLSVRPGYFPRALPWLMSWVANSRKSRVAANSEAIHQLHQSALFEWRRLLGDESYGRFIRESGQLLLWDTLVVSRAERIADALNDLHGVERQAISPEEIRVLVPGVSERVRRGVFLPRNGFTTSPLQLFTALSNSIEAGGARTFREEVLKVYPHDGGWRIMTNVGDHWTKQIVVAAGAWSQTLLRPLGIRIPLETERGYHVMLPDAGLELRVPILYKSLSIGLTPMAEGLRVAGTVEYAGLDAQPDEQRARILQDHARTLFPAINTDAGRYWMGHRPSIPDSLPVIGPVLGYPGLSVCFGHGQNGMTGGPLSGRLAAELVTGQRPTIDPSPYRPDRFSRGSRSALAQK